MEQLSSALRIYEASKREKEFRVSRGHLYYFSMERGPFVKVSPRKYRPRDSGAKLRARQKIHEVYKLRPAKLSDLDMQVGSINVEVVRR